MQDRLGAFQQIVLLGLVFFMTGLLRPAQLFQVDHQTIMGWTTELLNRGLAHAYDIDNFNYGPATAYVLYLFGNFMGTRLNEYHILIRQFFFLFDLGAIFILMRYLEWSGRNPMRALFVLLNLAFLYNSLIWGQMDGVMTTFLFASVVAGAVGQIEIAGALFVMAFNVKPQSIVLLPVLGLILIPALVRRPSRIATTLLVVGGTQLVLLLPFLQNGGWRDWILAYTQNVDLFPYASANAYNIWYLVLRVNPWVSDARTFLAVTYKTWGVLMFGLFGLLALAPLVLRIGVCTVKRAAYTETLTKLVFLTAGVVSVGFFFFTTQMHERYSYPAILFFGAYAVMTRDYFLYILVSVAHLLNINAVLPLAGFSVPFLPPFSLPRVVAGLFLVAVVVGLMQLYRMNSFPNDVRVILNTARARRARGALAPVTT